MRAIAREFLDSLAEDERAEAGGVLDDGGFREWKYNPGARPGLRIDALTGVQRELVYALLAAGMSPSGVTTLHSIMELEVPLKAIEKAIDHPRWPIRNPLAYYVRIFGDPTTDSAWAWRFNGHHVGVHFTVVGDEISATPQMFGANPRVHTAPDGSLVRTLAVEEDLGIGLMNDLSADQLVRAQLSADSPWDIASRNDPVVDIDFADRGIRYDELSGAQRDTVNAIIQLYLTRCADPLARQALREIEDAGRDAIRFSWAGPTGQIDNAMMIYYSVSGPTFLLEADRVNGNPNHIHTVWRDLRHDWGTDLLAEHYRTTARIGQLHD
ncbi:DUF3500 domain-containing protein [Amycolatopsis sp. NPDC051372]|uniref:DUF3500 domain-containing protein n=1 Tax=Amycolatopsis sp. NPDC051372 TaxID=3155669 RepID=UPI00343916CA